MVGDERGCATVRKSIQSIGRESRSCQSSVFSSEQEPRERPIVESRLNLERFVLYAREI